MPLLYESTEVLFDLGIARLMPYTIYVTVFSERGGAPPPAVGATVYVLNAAREVVDEFITDSLGRVYPPIELPAGTFLIYAEKNGYRSDRVITVTNGAPSSIPLFLEAVVPDCPKKVLEAALVLTPLAGLLTAGIGEIHKRMK